MDFDERILTSQHIEKAIERFCKERPKHSPAKSAFLMQDGEKLPAKFLLRLAFQEATGHWAKSETLTGGKASVRVLQKLGFDAIYDKKTVVGGKRNPIKNLRREAFRKVVENRWGEVVVEQKFDDIVVPDLSERTNMDPVIKHLLETVESVRGIEVKGRKGHKLAFDYYVPSLKLPIEFDERQHFTPLRAAILKAYPKEAQLGFDIERWISLSEEIRAGDNSPQYRDEQRAFYDSVRDICAMRNGFLPVVRVYEMDVAWEKDGEHSDAGLGVLRQISSMGTYP